MFLRKIEAPVLAIQRNTDEYGSRLQLEKINSHCNGTVYEIDNCGHQPHLEKPVVVQRIKQFLSIYTSLAYRFELDI